jgi:hypothetical protein
MQSASGALQLRQVPGDRPTMTSRSYRLKLGVVPPSQP